MQNFNDIVLCRLVQHSDVSKGPSVSGSSSNSSWTAWP